MNIKSDTRVADIVRANFKTADLLEECRIDFCCGGNKSLEKACTEAGVDMDALLTRLNNIVSDSDSESSYIRSLNEAELCDYIERRHHSFVRENIPLITAGLEKMCRAHGENHPEIFEVNDLFLAASENLLNHMRKEEEILFPHIRNMVSNDRKDSAYNFRLKEILNGPVRVMMMEHDAEGERFEKISQLTGNYTIPSDACNTFFVTYNRLRDFEKDLHKHIHLENNILFPSIGKMIDQDN